MKKSIKKLLSEKKELSISLNKEPTGSKRFKTIAKKLIKTQKKLIKKIAALRSQ